MCYNWIQKTMGHLHGLFASAQGWEHSKVFLVLGLGEAVDHVILFGEGQDLVMTVPFGHVLLYVHVEPEGQTAGAIDRRRPRPIQYGPGCGRPVQRLHDRLNHIA